LLFPRHPRDLEIAWRCCLGYSEVPPIERMGLRGCNLRLDGCCCIAIRLGVGHCRYYSLPDVYGRCCICILGAPSANSPSRIIGKPRHEHFRLSDFSGVGRQLDTSPFRRRAVNPSMAFGRFPSCAKNQSRYSYLSATMGTTRVARQTGTTVAANTTT